LDLDLLISVISFQI